MATGWVAALVTSPVDGSRVVVAGAVAVPSPKTPALVGYFQYAPLAAVPVGRLDPLVLARDDEAALLGAGRAGALVAVEVVHAAAGAARELDLVVDVLDAAGAARGLAQDLAVGERVDEAGGAEEVGEAVGLVGPGRVGDGVVPAVAGLRGLVDLAVLGPGVGALGRVVEIVLVGALRIDGIEEGDPLADRDLELADAVAVVDRADLQAIAGGRWRVVAGGVDRVGEGDDGRRRVAGVADRDGSQLSPSRGARRRRARARHRERGRRRTGRGQRELPGRAGRGVSRESPL